MERLGKTYRELTNYPKIYVCYWGSFRETDNNKLSKEIIDNRNNFIEKYNIKCSAKSIGFIKKYYYYLYNERWREKGCKLRVDHLELYKTNDNKYLYINSPYCVNEQEEQNLINDGWIKIEKLYSPMATTFLKYLDKEEITKFLKQINFKLTF